MPDDFPILRALVDCNAPIPALPILRVDAKAALAELERFRGVVAACVRTREKQRELEQAYEYLFAHDWKLLISRRIADRRVCALSICYRYSRVDQRADGSTPAEVIIALAAKVAESIEAAEREGA